MSVSRALLAFTLAALFSLATPSDLPADTLVGAGAHALLRGELKGLGLSGSLIGWRDHLGLAIDLDATWPDVARWRPLGLVSGKVLVGMKRGELYPHLYAGAGGGLARGVGFEEDQWATSYELGVGLVRRAVRFSVGMRSIDLQEEGRSQHVFLRITLGFGRSY
jgi:hypothetical protein